MTLRPGEHPDELISASLTNDLTDAERQDLARHLATCEHCRETLAAFGASRRLVSGLRQYDPPRDLAARVGAGIETARSPLGWLRRPSAWLAGSAALATVAAGILAVVVLSNLSNDEVGQASPSAGTASASVSSEPTASLEPSVPPSEQPTPLPIPSVDPTAFGAFEYTLRNQDAELRVNAQLESRPIGIRRYGLPVNAALSPDGDWVAFQVRGEASDLVDTYAYRISDQTVVTLAEGSLDSPFSRLAWSPDGGLLAFTVISQDDAADVWIFSPKAESPGAQQVTGSGVSYAASFYGGTDGEEWLWVSNAAEGSPTTYRIAIPDGGWQSDPVDPAQVALRTDAGTFLPMHAPTGVDQQAPTAVWRGEMARDASGWHFVRNGMLYLVAPGTDGEFALATGGTPAFETLQVPSDGRAFSSARFAWAPDGDGFAVWSAVWDADQQPPGFPDEGRVYFGHALQGVLIGPAQALDQEDTAGGRVINVALAGGQYLALTVQTAAGSESGAYGPTAELRIVTRNTGDQADRVEVVSSDGTWIGPAFYPAELDGGE